MSSAGWRRRLNRKLPHHREVETPPRRSKVLADSDELCHWALQMFAARGFYDLLLRDPEVPEKEREQAGSLADVWRRRFHDACLRSADELPLCQAMRDLSLNTVEREILTAMVLSDLGLIEAIDTVREMVDFLRLPDREAVSGLRALDNDGTLCKSGLLRIDDDLSERARRRLIVDPTLADNVLRDEREDLEQLHNPQALQAEVGSLIRLFARKVEAMESLERRSLGRSDEAFRLERLAWHKLRRIFAVLARHPDWGLTRLLEGRQPEDYRILLILAGKSLGQLREGHPLYRARGLSLACLDVGDLERLPEMLERISGDGLVAEGLIQPCAGAGALVDEDPEGLARVEFELTEQAVEALGFGQRQQAARRKRAGLRTPRVRLANLVLSAEIKAGLDLALSQGHSLPVMLKDWGLDELVPYGRSLTMIFYGPPGTGKTAAAEALAAELDRPFLVVDYSQLQNCFVGQTEKNIKATFELAQREGALLFFDEADAAFASRDMALRAFELSQANVLLRELERFEGICVLATNRIGQLDAALERRIQLKLHFERPDRQAREAIWRVLLPESLPLDPDVDPARLGRLELSGAEIKNAVLNAAREALQRVEAPEQARIRQQDLEAWARKEQNTGWNRKSEAVPIGFASRESG